MRSYFVLVLGIKKDDRSLKNRFLPTLAMDGMSQDCNPAIAHKSFSLNYRQHLTDYRLQSIITTMQEIETRQSINPTDHWQRLQPQKLTAFQGTTHSARLFSQTYQKNGNCQSWLHLVFHVTRKTIERTEATFGGSCIMFKRLLLRWATFDQFAVKKEKILGLLSKAEMTEYAIAVSIDVWKDTAFHLLQQLEQSGLVEWQSVERTGGDRHRVYRLTEEGRKEVERHG